MSRNISISAVVPVWLQSNDTEGLTVVAAAIESLGNVQKVIIDNGCTAGSGWLKSVADIFLRFPSNRGYTLAINRGILLADGEIIALINDDVRLPENWIKVCSEILQDESIATVHPKMMNYDDPFDFGDLVAKTGMERWCQNSFVITTRRFLDTMKKFEWNSEPYPGLFDENYGIGGGAEDWDFYFRVRKMGFKTCYTNKTSFQHLHSFSLKKLGPEREKIVAQNNEYFVKKWGKTKEEKMTGLYPEQMAKDYYSVLKSV